MPTAGCTPATWPRIDGEGYCRIVGRLKDMIIRGGENIYPREIEEFLYGHPAVQDVQVFGVPDAKFGEQVCAWVRLRDGSVASEAEIQDYCRQPARLLQGAALRAFRRRVSDDGDRQGAEVPDARGHGRRAGGAREDQSWPSRPAS